jgi:hypothetical protein
MYSRLNSIFKTLLKERRYRHQEGTYELVDHRSYLLNSPLQVVWDSHPLKPFIFVAVFVSGECPLRYSTKHTPSKDHHTLRALVLGDSKRHKTYPLSHDFLEI